MFAIIETGGKQFKVKENDIIFTEKLDAKINEDFIFKNVLCVGDDEKNIIETGYPYINNCSVIGTIIKHGLAKKLRVFTYKAKSNERKTKGHRQNYTKLKIKKINFDFNSLK